MSGAGATTIRPWKGDDREQVQALLKLLSQDTVVTSEDAPAYVAQRDGRVVGTVTLCLLTTLTGRKAFLDHLVVAPDWRRHGIGHALVEYAIEQARAAGASRIDLTANDEKQSGQALYRSLGFQKRHTASFRLDLTEPTAAIHR